MASKIGSAASFQLHYNALNDYIAGGEGLTIQPFKSSGWATIRGWNRVGVGQERTYLNNLFNTGNPLTTVGFQKQYINKNIFGRCYYINASGSTINEKKVFGVNEFSNFVNGAAPNSITDPENIITDTGKQRIIRVISSVTPAVAGSYQYNGSIYTGYRGNAANNNCTIELSSGLWTIYNNGNLAGVAEDAATNPWDVSAWYDGGNDLELNVQDDIREFTFQPLLQFVRGMVNEDSRYLYRYNIFALLCFDQYITVSTRWCTGWPGCGIPARRDTVQRVPFADLAWPAKLTAYYRKIRF